MGHGSCSWVLMSSAVATISRLLQIQIIGLICRMSSLLQGSFAKETCRFKEPTNHSHAICVMSHESWVMSLISESCHTHAWGMSHIWMSRVTHMHESCHTCAWIMSHMCISQVTHVHESGHTITNLLASLTYFSWVRSHIRMSQVTHMKVSSESCHTYAWVK